MGIQPLFSFPWGQKQPAKVHNVLPFPLFGGRAGQIEKKPGIFKAFEFTATSIGLQPLTVDTVDVAKRTSARIVLRPKNDVAAFLNHYSPELIKDTLLSLLDGKKPLNGAGDMIVQYQPPKDKKATPAQQLSTIVSAYQQQLKKLPKNVKDVTLELPESLPKGVDRAVLMRELAEATVLGGYNYNYQRSKKDFPTKLEKITFNNLGLSQAAVADAVKQGQVVGESINFARHIVDAPANFKTTRYISEKAREMASPTLDVQIREGDWLEGKAHDNTKRMGLFLSVGQGNAPGTERAPRLVEMVYTPKDGQYDKTILLVGKGIIFDTGGNNLKTSEYIHRMEGDMAGAAAVIATLQALDRLQIPGVRVVGLAPLTENRLGSAATLPNDIHTARNGKTVQISNTDAEGRLILADAMHYGMERYRPELVADIATLTGGKVRGVGEQNSVALSGNNPDLMQRVKEVETKQLGRVAEALKLTPNHAKWVTRGGGGKADVFNSVSGEDARRFGVMSSRFTDPREPMLQHSAQGAAFLREFLPEDQKKTPWVHYDMAGAEFEKPDPVTGEEWATGFGVKDLFHLVKGVAEGAIPLKPQKTEVVK